MKAKDAAINDESVFRRLAENSEESATAAILVHLCRESPELRHWLWEDFGRNARVRSKFAEIVKGAPDISPGGFTDLTDDGAALEVERGRLRAQFPAGLYGGLTWSQVVTLLRHYQAGTVDLGAFLLAKAWRETGKVSPLLLWAGAEFLDRVIPSGRRRLLKHLDRALGLLKRTETSGKRRAAFGYGDWWKLQVLLYILRHPKPSYQTRELRTSLAARKLPGSQPRAFFTSDLTRFFWVRLRWLNSELGRNIF